jgi:hypothetical protein
MIVISFILGFLVSDWLSAKIAKIAVRSSSESIRESVRKFAKGRNIDLQEKGRVVKTSAYDAKDAFNKGGNVLQALDEYGDTERSDLS